MNIVCKHCTCTAQQSLKCSSSLNKETEIHSSCHKLDEMIEPTRVSVLTYSQQVINLFPKFSKFPQIGNRRKQLA